MGKKNLNILLIMEQCNPEWASVPLVGYNFYHGIRQLADVTLVTHKRNEEALEKVRDGYQIDYISESLWIKRYYSMVSSITSRRGVNWPLQHALSYPVYYGFNRSVYRSYKQKVKNRQYDIVHALTPILPRYPCKIINACKKTPFILGPVNGGVPFPKGFRDVARKEFAHFNILRVFTRVIPGYLKTYKKADKVLSGSTYTMNMLKEMFAIDDSRIELFYENGIRKEFIGEPKKRSQGRLDLLFVGRLVPYKGADMAIDAISRLDESAKEKIRFTIVGDGSEKNNLEKQVKALGINNIVNFTGWVDQSETINYYKNADVFFFPSVREFGGAVALEAMACGLPCIVPDHAGLGEYVTEDTGFKIEPSSKEYLIKELAAKIQILLENTRLRESMSVKAIERAREFEWEKKAGKMIEVYEKVIAEKTEGLKK